MFSLGTVTSSVPQVPNHVRWQYKGREALEIADGELICV